MELRLFVTETIRQIMEGIADAQPHAHRSGGRVNPVNSRGMDHFVETGNDVVHEALPVQMIEFDVAVTTTEGTEKKGGIGIMATVVQVGGSSHKNAAHHSESRIKFAVPVLFPPHRKQA